MVQQPRVVLCDEPTAMLDPIASRAVASLLDDLVAAGAGLLLVSHDRRLVESRSRDVVDLDRR